MLILNLDLRTKQWYYFFIIQIVKDEKEGNIQCWVLKKQAFSYTTTDIDWHTILTGSQVMYVKI